MTPGEDFFIIVLSINMNSIFNKNTKYMGSIKVNLTGLILFLNMFYQVENLLIKLDHLKSINKMDALI